MGYEGINQWGSVFSNVFGAKKPTMKCYEIAPGKNDAAKALKNKRFVVKIQVPTGCKCCPLLSQCLETMLPYPDITLFDKFCLNYSAGEGTLMVYNEDRTIFFGIDSDNSGINGLQFQFHQ